MDTKTDRRIVMTLDAGGTNLKFSAIQGDRLLMDSLYRATEGHDLERCLANIVNGFEDVRARLPMPPVAISFAFPGPADYPAGIIGDLPNLPAFRGGVALGPLLEDRFRVPVFINNDGDLFAYGEAIAGFLPEVNAALEQAGSAKRYRNLLGVTLGTGFGGGIVRNGELFVGDNCGAGEVWLLRNKLDQDLNAEEGACIRAVRRVYGQLAGIPFGETPEPKLIAEIAAGTAEGDRAAAVEAFRRLGEVAGDAIAQSLVLVDGLCVIGGGVSGASGLFMPALVAAVNGAFDKTEGPLRRLGPEAFDFEAPAQRALFLKGARREISVPGTSSKLHYDPLRRTAIGMSRLGTSQAVYIGAYALALKHLA